MRIGRIEAHSSRTTTAVGRAACARGARARIHAARVVRVPIRVRRPGAWDVPGHENADLVCQKTGWRQRDAGLAGPARRPRRDRGARDRVRLPDRARLAESAARRRASAARRPRSGHDDAIVYPRTRLHAGARCYDVRLVRLIALRQTGRIEGDGHGARARGRATTARRAARRAWIELAPIHSNALRAAWLRGARSALEDDQRPAPSRRDLGCAGRRTESCARPGVSIGVVARVVWRATRIARSG